MCRCAHLKIELIHAMKEEIKEMNRKIMYYVKHLKPLASGRGWGGGVGEREGTDERAGQIKESLVSAKSRILGFTLR